MTGPRTRSMLKAGILCFALLLPASVAAQVSATCVAGGTEPTRWLVPHVEHQKVTGAYYGDLYCETTILVTNLSSHEALVQVDFDSSGHSCIQDEIAAGTSLAFGTAPMLPIVNLFFPASWGGDGTKFGQATVHAETKDISVSAFLVCRDAPISSPGKVTALTTLPAIPR